MAKYGSIDNILPDDADTLAATNIVAELFAIIAPALIGLSFKAVLNHDMIALVAALTLKLEGEGKFKKG